MNYNRLERLKYKHKLMEKYTQWFKETFELLVERRVRAWESSARIDECMVIEGMNKWDYRRGESEDLIAERVDLLADVIFSVSIKGSMWLQMLPYLAQGFSRSRHFPRMDEYGEAVNAHWKEYFDKMPEKFGGYVHGMGWRTYSFASFPDHYLFAFKQLDEFFCESGVMHTTTRKLIEQNLSGMREDKMYMTFFRCGEQFDLSFGDPTTWGNLPPRRNLPSMPFDVWKDIVQEWAREATLRINSRVTFVDPL